MCLRDGKVGKGERTANEGRGEISKTQTMDFV